MEVKEKTKSLLASTLKIEAQVLMDILKTEYLDTKHVAYSVENDVLINARSKEEQLNTTLNILKNKVNEYWKVVSAADDGRPPLNYSALLLRVKELYTKLHSIKLKYKVTNIAAASSKDHDGDFMVKLQKLTNP